MATDQGKTSNVAGLAIMAELTGKTIAETGVTMFRPPYTPVAIGALAGHHRGRISARAPHAGHQWSKASLAPSSSRPACGCARNIIPARRDRLAETVNREVLAVRGGVGVCDVSTLGKIDIQGADAAPCSTASISTPSRPSRRQGALWRDAARGRLRHGRRHDARLGEDAFLMTDHHRECGQGDAASRILPAGALARSTCRSRRSASNGRNMAIAGPGARSPAAALSTGTTSRTRPSPIWPARTVSVGGGVEARLFRVSFSGELAYELAVPGRYGDALARALMAAGRPFGVTPYGLEAMGVMRIEKGHVAGGELNGQTTARDLGLGA
jgi:glycine cleavage system aminomethyltransferase T